MPSDSSVSDPPLNNTPPATEKSSNAAAAASANPSSKPEIEYDDFGLPIRKARPRTPLPPDSDDDSEDGEVFKDAVSKSPSRENLAQLGKVKGEVRRIESGLAVKEVDRSPSPSPSRTRSKTNESRNDVAVKPEKEESIQKEDGEGKEEGKNLAKQSEKDLEQEKEGHLEKDKGEDLLEEKAKDVEKDKKAELQEIPKDKENQADKAQDKTLPSETTESSKSQNRLSNFGNGGISEFSHQQLAPQNPKDKDPVDELDDGGWQTMPAYAHYDMYDDDNKLIAKENADELEDMSGYGNVGGAAKGYTRVIMDEDVESVTSMDDNTAYLFKEKSTALLDEDEAARDPLSQMQTTKNILTEGQRVAYVGLVRLGLVDMKKKFEELERNKNTKKIVDMVQEANQMWAQKMMVRLYAHMDINETEQIMIEQLSEHGVIPADLTPTLMQNARVKNPVPEEDDEAEKKTGAGEPSISSPRPSSVSGKDKSSLSLDSKRADSPAPPPYDSEPPPYQNLKDEDMSDTKTPFELPDSENVDIDLRWTILCDLFLVLIADTIYDSRSRQLLEQVGKYLSVDWLEICRFEKRVTEALEMQEEANKENWNEEEHMEDRRKKALKKRIAYMGIATVGGTLVIGLSAGLLAPLIAGGLVTGFATIGMALPATAAGAIAGAGGIAAITTTAAVSGGTIAVRAASKRTGAVKTFEYRPLHNNKRANLIITLAGWMNGTLDDVRLPYSTIDPAMGDIYSVLWEPEVLRSMGDTINILATEALTQGLQQVLASTILAALMGALQLPLILSKLSYLIDNPWSVSQDRGDMAGLILADSLMARNLGTRPITLVGFSLGSRVIFSCLKELAKRGAVGLVQNVYMFGTPLVAKKDEYIKAKSIVPGRFVNGYATNDWILGYLFRATSGGIMRVAGLAPVDVPGIENYNVTELVPGHMAYRQAMPKLLREVGWIVESDEFAEIEDPDPENHEKRQRELINEIEEARKELEKKPEKKGGFSFWRKKKAQKKEWEVYDEKSQGPSSSADKTDDPNKNTENPAVLFDVDAIRREIASMSYDDPEPIEIKEIKSTLPPMKIDISQKSPNPFDDLRKTKSYNDGLPTASSIGKGASAGNLSTYSAAAPINGTSSSANNNKYSFEEYDEYDEGEVSMTFDSSFKEPSAPSYTPAPAAKSPLPASSPFASPQPPAMDAWGDYSNPPAMSSWGNEDMGSTFQRPPLRSAATEPPSSASNPNAGIGYNAWADEFEDDFGQEKEMKMSFM
ncbi:DUF726-domain-containing protein [Periconia macrospinosa]|uniref:DUF726-domain-containing protein n=1 Tax=Periconia macrospinosa TaxID=97972 RepID=A0A2V1ECE7_9PLEO|nr:DUF726-domain-containing protein [Periconia macrospinosa]